MRPVSGDDLVTAALQSSLARAQKNYKLSNFKQLCKSPGKFAKKSAQGGNAESAGVLGTVKKSKALKFQSEFELWLEQAQEFSFCSEAYTNGAAVPEDIECLNSSNRATSKQNSRSSSVLEPIGELQKNKKEFSKEGVAAKERKVDLGDKKALSEASTVLKGKGKKPEIVTTENSFELFSKFNESKKLKKKLLKFRKILLKRGYSEVETQKLIEKAGSNGGSAGAIIQKLKQAILQKEKGKENTALQGKIKKSKMKDLSAENGECSTSVSRAETPPAHPLPSSSATSPRIMNGGCANASGNNSGNQHQLPQPKRILYPREKIIPGYVDKMPVGAGFYNMGNSCYLNASLQAVFHVPAFINWLKLDGEHRKHCQDSGSCIICAMKKTLDSATGRSSTTSPPGAIRPVEIINRLRSICRHFSHGRQEDAHEFLRYLFESMERSYLTAINCLRIDNRSKETNPLGQIFGGYLRTEVTCQKCHYVSTTFQPTAELQLDIRHVTTLEDAIMNHFKKERLDNNDYKCEKCRTISQATKQFSLEIPPIVLCLQLKRFTLYGTKIAKRIHCNRFLDMSRYMHKSKQVNGYSNIRYRLVALVTHLGSSPNCGHYTAIAEASNGHFYQFDDSFVNQVTVANALNNDAYVIIYEMDRRCNKSPESSLSSSSASSTATSGYSSNMTNLTYPSSTVTSSSSSSATITSLFPKKLSSTPIPKISSSVSSSSTTTSSKLVQNDKPKNDFQPCTNGNGLSESMNGTSTSGNGSIQSEGLQRKMISFGIRPPASPSPRKITILKPGASLTNSSRLGHSSSNGINATKSLASSSCTSSKVANQKSDQSIRLVPYNDDEESDKDENIRNGAGVSPNGSIKRLKSPESFRKQSPGRNNVHHDTPVTPPKSPKPSSSFSTTSGSSSNTNLGTAPFYANSSKTEAASSTTPKPLENGVTSVQRDAIKRKAPSDEETTPKKSHPHRRRHSSTSSTSSNSSSGSSGSRRNSKSKRKRSEEAPSNKSSPEKKLSSSHSSSSHEYNRKERGNGRDSHSQERDRERRRDRNPSRSRSPSVENNHREIRGSSVDKRRETNCNGGTSFDASRLRQEHFVVGWNGEKSQLSRSMEEDRKRNNEKSLDEEYNEEFDEGRAKKVRRSRSLPRDSETGVGGNRFQAVEDRKKQVQQWSSILDGYGPGFRRSGSGGSNGGNAEPRSWSSGGGDGPPRNRRDFSPSPRPGSSNGSIGSRPRHSSSNGSSQSSYSRNSHGRSPYKNGHHNGSNSAGGNHYRSQSHGSYNHNNSNNGNKHWNDRNRH